MKSGLPKNTDLPDDTTFKNYFRRGSSVVSVREDGLIAVIKWMDNNSVSMISTNEAVEPLNQVQRWSKVEKKQSLG